MKVNSLEKRESYIASSSASQHDIIHITMCYFAFASYSFVNTIHGIGLNDVDTK